MVPLNSRCPSGVLTKVLYVSIFFLMRATGFTHLILLGFIPRQLFSDKTPWIWPLPNSFPSSCQLFSPLAQISSSVPFLEHPHSLFFPDPEILRLTTRATYTGLFISPSGISELECAKTKTDTAERSISIGRESLKDYFCTRGLGVLAGSTARG